MDRHIGRKLKQKYVNLYSYSFIKSVEERERDKQVSQLLDVLPPVFPDICCINPQAPSCCLRRTFSVAPEAK
jgi:hypothetical protein